MSLVARASLLLFASGFCALVYQIAWLRMLRLVFGASTAATAAVLAIFMGGLGLGGIILGRRADRSPSPLGLYARLELLIAVAAAASPVLIAVVRGVYLGVGGSSTLGSFGGTLARLLLATLVLGVPTFLMGGTLPAVARAIESSHDVGRRRAGFLYGANTIGAVAGAFFGTFFALELFGTRGTLLLAAAVNLGVAGVAWAMASGMAPSMPDDEGAPAPEASASPASSPPAPSAPAPAPVALVLGSAAAVGFAFLLMELVWYRVLTPILGGTSYTFGLILVIALLGIGTGGLLYGRRSETRRPTVAAFALTCALEAVFVAIPLGAGDRIAAFALVARPIGDLGFWYLVGLWTLITVPIVLPAAIVSGYQLPLLVALLGSGRRKVGAQVGQLYALNTAGAILGSLAGGFGLLPILSATGAWRAVVVLLVGTAAAGAGFVLIGRREPRRGAIAPAIAGAIAVILAFAAVGPTVAWRHNEIGWGRKRNRYWGGNVIRGAFERHRWSIVWEADGVESTVGINARDGYSFIVNGRSDGHILGDSPTQVGSGLIPAALHPEPKRAFVVGLGTGCTAGWIGQVPSIERVDVAELEPAVLEMAARCAPANGRVLENEKVNVILGDGREVLLTSGDRYDLIVSEPSNPFRAGIASLFTRDFYEAVDARLADGGIFVQWVQGYEVDLETVRTIYATLGSVFPHIESWEVKLGGDLLLLATREPIVHDVERVTARMKSEPWVSAFRNVWGVGGAEGFYTGFLARSSLARRLGGRDGTADADEAPPKLNTDDDTVIEWGFARALGRPTGRIIGPLRLQAAEQHEHQPALVRGEIDWRLVDELRLARRLVDRYKPFPGEDTIDPVTTQRVAARQNWDAGNLAGALRIWMKQSERPRCPIDVVLLAEALAASGDGRYRALADVIEKTSPAVAAAIRSLHAEAAGRLDEAVDEAVDAFEHLRVDPWFTRDVMLRLLARCRKLAASSPTAGGRLFDALEQPFAVEAFRLQRLMTRIGVANVLADDERRVAALAAFEPHPPWQAGILTMRAETYERVRHPMAARARADLDAHLAAGPSRLPRVFDEDGEDGESGGE